MPFLTSTMCHAILSQSSLAQQKVNEKEDLLKETMNVEKKRVSFHNDVRVYPHIHINDLSRSEVANSWYNSEEISGIKSECQLTINLASKGELHKWSNLCFRGLEYRTPDGSQRRSANKFAAWDAVMDEQEIQYQNGVQDEDALAQLYIQASKHCQDAAHALAMEDFETVSRLEEPANYIPGNFSMIKSSRNIQGSSSPKRRRQVLCIPSPVRHNSAAAA
jgi:hypothetical protein